MRAPFRPPVDDHRRGPQPRARGLVVGGRQRLVDQRLAAPLLRPEDRQQPGHADLQRAVLEPFERLAEQRHALLVDRAVRADLGEPERGLGQRLGIAVAAGGGRGLREPPARLFDVAGADRRLGQVEHRLAALGGRRLGTEGERLERVRVMGGGLGVAERGARLARGLERHLPRGLRLGAGAGRGERVVGDLGGGDVGARVAAHDQRVGHRLVDRAAPLLGQRLADRVAHDPVREREVARRLGIRGDQPGRGPAVERLGRRGAGDLRGAHEVDDREAAGDRADLEHRAGVVAEPLDAPPHDLAHARGNERARVVADLRPGGQVADELGDVERVAGRALVDLLGGELGRQQCPHGLRAEAAELHHLRARVALDLAQEVAEADLGRSCRRRPAAAAHRRGRARAAAVTRRQPSAGRRAPAAAGARPQRPRAGRRRRRRASGALPRRRSRCRPAAARARDPARRPRASSASARSAARRRRGGPPAHRGPRSRRRRGGRPRWPARRARSSCRCPARRRSRPSAPRRSRPG